MKRWNRYALSLVMALAVSGCCEMEYFEVPLMPGTDVEIDNPTQLKVITHEESTETENLEVYLFSEDDGEKKADAGKFELRPVGYGKQDVAGIIKASEEAGAKWIVVEQDDPSMGKSPMECAQMSIEYIKSLNLE
jgi:hypothetical protein